MLILSRKVGEEIVIGSEVVIGVARVSRRHVSLTVQAPMNVRVDRKEIHLAKNRDRRSGTLQIQGDVGGVGRNEEKLM